MSDCFDHMCDAFDRYLEGEDWGPQPWEKTCRRCGTGGLEFYKLPSGKYWLCDHDGVPHRCPISPEGQAKLREFGL